MNTMVCRLNNFYCGESSTKKNQAAEMLNGISESAG